MTIFNPDDVAARFAAPPKHASADGDPINTCTPAGLEQLLDLLVRAEQPPAALASRAGLTITQLASLIAARDNLKTIRALTRMYDIYRGSLAARLKTHALVQLTQLSEDTWCDSIAQARQSDVRRKACVDLLRTNETSPLVAAPATRRTGRRTKAMKTAMKNNEGSTDAAVTNGTATTAAAATTVAARTSDGSTATGNMAAATTANGNAAGAAAKATATATTAATALTSPANGQPPPPPKNRISRKTEMNSGRRRAAKCSDCSGLHELAAVQPTPSNRKGRSTGMPNGSANGVVGGHVTAPANGETTPSEQIDISRKHEMKSTRHRRDTGRIAAPANGHSPSPANGQIPSPTNNRISRKTEMKSGRRRAAKCSVFSGLRESPAARPARSSRNGTANGSVSRNGNGTGLTHNVACRSSSMP